MAANRRATMASHIGRRKFLATLGGTAAAWPLAARAQQPERTRLVGVLMLIANDSEGKARLKAFRQGLEEHKWTEHINVRIEERWSGGDAERIKAYATELVSLTPDAILAMGGRALTELRQRTRTIPVVFVALTDPVGQGFVASLARPGGNITGFSLFRTSVIGKMLEALKQIAPQVTSVAMMYHPHNVSAVHYSRILEGIALSVGVKPVAAPVRDAAEIERAIDDYARRENFGLLLPTDAMMLIHREMIASLALRHRLPSVYAARSFVSGGGLISYGPDTIDLFRRAGGYVDRILRGKKPGELPVQAPTKFELVINLKTAKALGLEVPLLLQQLADELIE
jgi:putative ABC transport system substrate-binding protein